jgi:hypothetical protein
MSNRKGFSFLRSYYDVLEDIYDDSDKLSYLLAILDKQFKGIEPKLSGIPKLVYKGQKHNIDKSVEGYENKTGEKLSTPYEDPTEGPTEGGSQDPTKDPTEGPYQHPSNDIVMTTEGPTEDPYLQEQEQEQEEVEEQVEVKEQVKEKLKKEDIVSIHYIMDIENCSYDEAMNLYLQQKELIFN